MLRKCGREHAKKHKAECEALHDGMRIWGCSWKRSWMCLERKSKYVEFVGNCTDADWSTFILSVSLQPAFSYGINTPVIMPYLDIPALITHRSRLFNQISQQYEAYPPIALHTNVRHRPYILQIEYLTKLTTFPGRISACYHELNVDFAIYFHGNFHGKALG